VVTAALQVLLTTLQHLPVAATQRVGPDALLLALGSLQEAASIASWSSGTHDMATYGLQALALLLCGGDTGGAMLLDEALRHSIREVVMEMKTHPLSSDVLELAEELLQYLGS
jgi:hypothetical protein